MDFFNGEREFVLEDAFVEINSKITDNFELTKFVVNKSKRKKGIGSAIMFELIKQADEQGIILEVTPAIDYGATSINRLKRFYKRFGFIENTNRNKRFEINNTMYRLPL